MRPTLPFFLLLLLYLLLIHSIVKLQCLIKSIKCFFFFIHIFYLSRAFHWTKITSRCFIYVYM
ncbi:hypothetical protein BY458DRAFT_523055 [Sporodiniella umbellata]|nr:hypothetical protein BY458DRAFT_523055 [Sporodiniella umbellata]